MGPVSKEAVCDALGFLIDEAQTTRVLLQQIKGLLEQRGEHNAADLDQVNRRMTELEREVREKLHGTSAAHQ